jgi:predicted aspartyl protease
MHLKLLAASVLAALAFPNAAFAQGEWPEDCKLVRMAQLPMRFGAGHVMIPADVNGKEVAFIVDTGGFVSGLSRKTIAQLGIVPHRMNSVVIRDITGKVADEYVRVDQFKIGNLSRDGVYLSVIEPMAEADGLMAPDILQNYDAEFDFGGGMFSLFRHHSCSDHAVYWTGSYAALPFSLTHDGHVRVPVTLDGKDTYAIIDTGAPLSVLSMQAASRMFGLDAQSPNVAEQGVLMGGSGGQVKAYTYPFQALTVGGVSVTSPRIKLSEGRNFLGDDSASLLLGMDVLRHLHLYFAYHEQKLYATAVDAH